MNIYLQVVLNSCVLMFGILCLFPVLPKASALALVGLSWFMGWGLIGFVEIVLVGLGVYVSLPWISSASLSMLVALWVVFGPRPFRNRVEKARCLPIIAVFLGSVLCFVLLAQFGNYVNVSTDSVTNEGLARVFHKFGVYGDERSLVHEWLFNIRLPFFIAINNIGFLCEIEVFHSFPTATTLFLTVTFLGLWGEARREYRFGAVLGIVVIVCAFLSNRLIVFHSFYLLSNLTTMAYYSVGVLCLCRFQTGQEERWFTLACMFLGITGILRKEMVAFSLLPLIFIFFRQRFRVRTVVRGFCVFLLFAYFWFLAGVFRMNGMAEMMTAGFETKGHAGLWVQTLFLLATAAVFFAPWGRIREMDTLKRRVAVSGVGLLLVLICCGESFVQTGHNLYLLMFQGEGQWGFFWYVMAVAAAFFVAGKVFMGRDVWGVHHVNIDLLFFTIFGFLILRLALYAFFETPKDSGWNDSGNRILLHIFPVCLWFFGELINGAWCRIRPAGRNTSV